MTTHPPSLSGSDPDQQVDNVHHERDQALASAQRWRRLYEVEAQQRQKDAEIADQTIQQLRAEVQHLCQFSTAPLAAIPSSPATGASNSVAHLRHQIADLIAERDQLLQALAQEQSNHAKTRENLISALGDALGTQKQKRSPALPSSPAGARAGAIILKDRKGRKAKS